MLKNYEYTYLTRQDMSEESAKDLSARISESIKAKLGTIVDTPRSYKKRLAYRIKKQDAAFVNTIMFTLETDKLDNFKKETDAMTEILRGLIVSYDPKKLEREDRREPRSSEERTQETPVAVIKETPAQPAAKIKEEKAVEPKIVKEEKKEEVKEVAQVKETKEVKEEKVEKEVKETKKTAKKEDKPKEKEEKAASEITTKTKRRTKIKTELKDIEQKLDEILK